MWGGPRGRPKGEAQKSRSNKTGTHKGCPYEMTYDPDVHHRRSIRLRGYDYSQPGAYYITICTEDNKCWLGEVVWGQMKENDAGRMVDGVWTSIPARFPTAQLDEYSVMPNHFHGIIQIVGSPLVGARDRRVGARGRPDEHPKMSAPTNRAPTRGAPTFGDIVGAFKSITTDEYIRGVQEDAWPRFTGRLWQRNFYEHIVRDEDELQKIRDYIRRNPLMWAIESIQPKSCGTRDR